MRSPEVLKFLKRGNTSTFQTTLPPRNALPKATVWVLRLFSFENKQIHIPGNSCSKFPMQRSEIGGRASSPTGERGRESRAHRDLCAAHTGTASQLRGAVPAPSPAFGHPECPHSRVCPWLPRAPAGGARLRGSSPRLHHGLLPEPLRWRLPWKHYRTFFIW